MFNALLWKSTSVSGKLKLQAVQVRFLSTKGWKEEIKKGENIRAERLNESR